MGYTSSLKSASASSLFLYLVFVVLFRENPKAAAVVECSEGVYIFLSKVLPLRIQCTFLNITSFVV